MSESAHKREFDRIADVLEGSHFVVHSHTPTAAGEHLTISRAAALHLAALVVPPGTPSVAPVAADDWAAAGECCDPADVPYGEAHAEGCPNRVIPSAATGDDDSWVAAVECCDPADVPYGEAHAEGCPIRVAAYAQTI